MNHNESNSSVVYVTNPLLPKKLTQPFSMNLFNAAIVGKTPPPCSEELIREEGLPGHASSPSKASSDAFETPS